MERHAERYEDHVSNLNNELRWSQSRNTDPVAARHELDPDKSQGRTEEASAVEDLPEVGDGAAVPGSDDIKRLPGRGEEQHSQSWEHREQTVLKRSPGHYRVIPGGHHLGHSEAERLPDEEGHVDGEQVEAEGGAEMSEPESVDSRRAQHLAPRDLQLLLTGG